MIAPSDLERLRINRYYRCIRQDLERINIIYDHLCFRFWQHYVENLSWNKSRFRSTWLTCVQPFSETKKEKKKCPVSVKISSGNGLQVPCSRAAWWAATRCHGFAMVHVLWLVASRLTISVSASVSLTSDFTAPNFFFKFLQGNKESFLQGSIGFSGTIHQNE